MSSVRHIDIGREWDVYLGPRLKKDGTKSGQDFRETILLPALQQYDVVVVGLDSIRGYTASFLEEAFGGAVRALGYDVVKSKLQFDAIERRYLVPTIETYMREAAAR